MNNIRIAKELVRLAKEIMVDSRKDVLNEIWKDPKVKELVLLLLRIWNIEGMDWAKAKKTLREIGRNDFIRKMEALPYFKEVKERKYELLMKKMSKEEKRDFFDKWNDFDRKELAKIEGDLIKWYTKKNS